MATTAEVSMFNSFNNKEEGKNETRIGNWESDKAEEAPPPQTIETTTTYRLAHVNPNSVKAHQLPYDMEGARSKRELESLKAIVDKEFNDAEAKASATSRAMAPMSQSHEEFQAAPLEKYLEARAAKTKGEKKEYLKPLPPVEGKYTDGTTVTIWEQSLADPSVEFTKSFIMNPQLPFGRSSCFSTDM